MLSGAGASYRDACLAKVNTCTGLNNDWCTPGDVPWKLFPDTLYQTLTPCFSKACGTVDACLEATTTIFANACN